MQQPDSSQRSRRFTPAGIALLYAAFSVLWILASGTLLTLNIDDPDVRVWMEQGKGLLFVLVTSCLLYVVLMQWRDPLPLPKNPAYLRSTLYRWRSLAFVVLATFVPLTGFVVIKAHGPQVEHEAFGNLESIADLKARQIENWLNERYRDGDLLASPLFLDHVAALQKDGDSRVRDVVQAHLAALVSPLKYDGALLVDPQGKPLAETGLLHEMDQKTAESLPRALESRLPLLVDVVGEGGDDPHIDFIIPLFEHGNGLPKPLGALILRDSPERFLFPYLLRWPTMSASGETLLIRRDGDSVVFINEPRHYRSCGLSTRLSIKDGRSYGEMVVNEGRLGTTFVDQDCRGIPVLGAFRPVTGTDWIVVAKLDREEVMKPLNALAFWVSLVVMIAIFAVGIVMLLLWHQRGRNLRLEMQAQTDNLLRQFYELPFIGFAVTSPATMLLIQCNDRLCEILGYSREEIIRLGWRELTHPDDLAAYEAEMDKITRGETDGFTQDKRYIRKDGRTVFATVNVKCVRKADGAPKRLLSMVQDVTEGKQAEAEIRQLTGLYAALSECNEAIVRCTSPEELFPQVCRFAVQFGGMKMAWIGLLDKETGRVIPAAGYGDATNHLADAVISVDPETPYGQGCVGRAIRGRKPVWIQDYQNDPGLQAWHARAASAGWMGTGAVPLSRNGQVVGVFSFNSPMVNAFSEKVCRLLEEMGQDVSFALDVFDREARRRRMEDALRESESRFRNLYEKAPLAYLSLDAEGRIQEANDAWLALLGRTRDETLGRPIGDFLDNFPFGRPRRETRLPGQTGPGDGALYHAVHADGSQRLLMVNEQTARDPEGNFLRLHCIVTDLTERFRAEEQLKLAAKVLEQSAEGVVITDHRRRILTVNRAFTEITGYDASEAVGRNLHMLTPETYDEPLFRAVWKSVLSAGYWQGEISTRRKNGGLYPALASISRVLDANGKVSHFAILFSDISEQKASQEHIQRLAHFDSLTGLPNRSLLADRVGQALSRMERNGETLALIFLDLDRFKNVNDSLGHRVGDKLLFQVSERLKATLREEDTVSRLGGDEFIVVLPSVSVDGAAHVAEKIQRSLSLPYRIDQHELIITPTMGIAMYPSDGENYEALSMCADIAMYRAKRDGRNIYRFFTREMQEHSDRTLLLENALRRALELGQLQLYYQPQMALRNDRIVGVEALLRWQHPDLGMVSPGEFIPVAEDSGLILPIGEWVLREAVRQMTAWMEAGLGPKVMAVNLSAVQFRQASLPELVSAVIDEFDLPPQCLELELTESVTMDDPASAIAMMDELHDRGIRMSIDDFGTGYSSLNHLKRFRVCKLKIDQSFVRDIASDPEDAAIVEAIVSMSRSLDLKTIAEGVETAEELAFLREKGCDEVQGYFIGRPMPAEQFEAFIRRNRR